MKATIYILFLIVISSCAFNRNGNKSAVTDTNYIHIQNDTMEHDIIKSYIHPDTVYTCAPLKSSRSIGNYIVELIRVPNQNVMQKIGYDGSVRYFHADNSIYFTIHYKGTEICKNKKYTKESFGQIDRDELDRNVLMLSDNWDAKVKNDTLVVNVDMYWPDSDIGNAIFINVTPHGEFSYQTIELDGGDGSLDW